MRSAGCGRVFSWFCAMCALGLLVLAPLTAANAQEAAASASASAELATEKPSHTEAEAQKADAEREEEEEEEGVERTEPNLSLSVQLGAGYLSGGHGGLFDANRSPLGLDVQVLTVREPRYLIGGALRIELEGAHAVAVIPRFQLRHAFGPIELRPGIGVPFYIAPRTMLGPEAGLWGRLSFSQELALLLAFSASAFVMGDDVPKGNTVIMLQIFVGVELFI